MSEKTKKTKRAAAVEEFVKLSKRKSKIIDKWALDPEPRNKLKTLVRAAKDFEKLRIAANNRQDSPTATNPTQIEDEDLRLLLALGKGCDQWEKALKGSMKYFLQQSEIGLWLLEQRGLGSGWLGGFLLAEFPDIYDAARCNKCGKYLERQADMTYKHTKPPERKDGDPKDKCEFDGEVMEPENYFMHERKPSTFVRFAGLDTIDHWACPDCEHTLAWQKGSNTILEHKNYEKIPEIGKCRRNKHKFILSADKTRATDREDGVDALSVKASPMYIKGKKNSWKGALRARLIGTMGVADAFVMQKHPKYYEIYAGYKNRKIRECEVRGKMKMAGWIDKMAKRAMIRRFIIDFFIKWRETEGLPVRPPYEVEKLGIVHHN